MISTESLLCNFPVSVRLPTFAASICDMEYTVSQRNKPLLIFNGYRYRKDRVSLRGRVTWRCVRPLCLGRIMVDGDAHKLKTSHNHGPDFGENKAVQVRENMRKMARESQERTSAIVRASISGLSEEAAVRLPTYESSKKIIYRARRSGNSAADSSGIVELPDSLKVTAHGDKFLLYKTESDAEEEPIIFGTHAN